eukprot:scaffold21978_cov73-Cylindrotheca_fusiformis.AAC.1
MGTMAPILESIPKQVWVHYGKKHYFSHRRCGRTKFCTACRGSGYKIARYKESAMVSSDQDQN